MESYRALINVRLILAVVPLKTAAFPDETEKSGRSVLMVQRIQPPSLSTLKLEAVGVSTCALPWDKTQASAMTGWRSSTWAIAVPSGMELNTSLQFSVLYDET
jgi:hypothetical protein